MSSIFHIDENHRVVQLNESKYESEDLLQKLVAQYPDILAGEQINPEAPRKWILISREMGVPGQEGGCDQWFLDHLFIDQDGIPTFVEVKRSTNTQIRREVVAQMLDYAANATAYWPVERLQQTFEASHDELTEAYSNIDVTPEEADAYWSKVDSNLRLGKIRLLFVADEIPASLQRIIEFLNSQMKDTEVLGVEIRQYVSEAGQRTLVPNVLGRTAASIQVKSSPGIQWTEEMFLDRVSRSSGEAAKTVCEKLLNDFREMGCDLQWGKGSVQGGFTPFYERNGRKHRLTPVYLHKTATTVEIPFNEFKAPLDAVEIQAELRTNLNLISRINIPKDRQRPSFDCILLSDDTAYTQFVEICKNMMEKILAYESDMT